MTVDEPPRIDTSVAHPARRYNYWLGGKDNYQVDRDSADAIEAIYPHTRTAAVHNRLFLQRVVRHLVREAGIRQFLDIGTGLPTADNTHEVAQQIDPLNDDALTATLNMNEPIALLLIAVLHFLPDSEHAYQIVKTLMNGLPAGSYLAISHGISDFVPAPTVEAVRAATSDFTTRNHAEVAGFFTGLDQVPPGVTPISQWRNPDTDPPPPEHVPVCGGLARKPGQESKRG